MNFDNLDWFVYVDDTYQPLLRSIADLDKNIKDERNPRTREAKKKERKKLWDNTWERVAAECLPVPHNLHCSHPRHSGTNHLKPFSENDTLNWFIEEVK